MLCGLCVLLPSLFRMLAVASCSVVPLLKSQGGGGCAFHHEGSENPSFFRPCFLSHLLEYKGTVFGVPLVNGLLAVVWGKGQNLPQGFRSEQRWARLGRPICPSLTSTPPLEKPRATPFYKPLPPSIELQAQKPLLTHARTSRIGTLNWTPLLDSETPE